MKQMARLKWRMGMPKCDRCLRETVNKADKNSAIILCDSCTKTTGAIDKIQMMCDNMTKAESLTNEQLSDALLNDVFADLDLDGWPSAIMSEAIKRL